MYIIINIRAKQKIKQASLFNFKNVCCDIDPNNKQVAIALRRITSRVRSE